MALSSGNVEPTRIRHVVAMPYPGRGHINPMLSFCKVVAAKANSRILVTFVLTEEWLGFMASEPKPDNLRFVSIPNVVPSELARAADLIGFLEAVWTKLEEPFERLLDTELVEPPPSLIMADTYMGWAVGVGERRNIPVASFWTMSSSMYSFYHNFHLLAQNGHFPVDLQGEGKKGEQRVQYLPGVSSTKLADLPSIIDGKHPYIVQQILKQFTFVPKTHYLLLPSTHELEPHAVDALKHSLSLPIYTVGPTIPYFTSLPHDPDANYFHWLDRQPRASVLYVSLGSFLSASASQMDELGAGLRESGVRFMWAARGDASRRVDGNGDMGLVVPWCEQLRVLMHSSVGGFLTHCGWSSVMEGLFCGVPMLTLPLVADQGLNGKMVVEDWRVGRRVRECGDVVCSREEIGGVVRWFMDLESEEGKEMRRRGEDLKEVCRRAVAEGGSSEKDIDSFVSSILK